MNHPDMRGEMRPIYINAAPTGWKSVPLVIRIIAWLIAISLAAPLVLGALFVVFAGAALAILA